MIILNYKRKQVKQNCVNSRDAPQQVGEKYSMKHALLWLRKRKKFLLASTTDRKLMNLSYLLPVSYFYLVVLILINHSLSYFFRTSFRHYFAHFLLSASPSLSKGIIPHSHCSVPHHILSLHMKSQTSLFPFPTAILSWCTKDNCIWVLAFQLKVSSI